MKKIESLSPNYDIGTFYMPFWWYPGTDPMDGNWKIMNDYDTYLVGKGLASKVRIPMQNYLPSPVWYDEKMISVTEMQFEIMHNYGIDFVVLDSFWKVYGTSPQFYGPAYHSVIDNVITPGFNNHGVEFAIMWADEFTHIVNQGSCDGFFNDGGLDAMLNYWGTCFTHSNYKKIDGKPVFYIFYPSTISENFDGVDTTNSIEGMCGYCKDNSFFASLGPDINEPYINNIKTNFLLRKIEEKLGYSLYFVAVIEPPIRKEGEPPINDWHYKYSWLIEHPSLAGFDSLTCYGHKYFEREDAFSNTFTTMCNCNVNNLKWSYDYSTMTTIHEKFWHYVLNNSSIDYQIPVSAGWNRAPLNMYEVNVLGKFLPNAADCNLFINSNIDQADSTPALYETALASAKAHADSFPTKTRKIIMLSAWNEYAEGTVIEPTYTWGFQYLQKVLDTFG